MSAKIFVETTFISRQTLRHHRWAKDERESQRSLLERPERNRVLSTSDTFASGRGDRQGAPAQQPVLGDTPIRTGPSPYAWGSLAISYPAPGRSSAFPLSGMMRTSNGKPEPKIIFGLVPMSVSLSFYRQDDEVTGGAHRLGPLC